MAVGCAAASPGGLVTGGEDDVEGARTVYALHAVQLDQLTADACGLPVLAGPAEAAAYGNVPLQARAVGEISGDRTQLRRLIRESSEVRRFSPLSDEIRRSETAN